MLVMVMLAGRASASIDAATASGEATRSESAGEKGQRVSRQPLLEPPPETPNAPATQPTPQGPQDPATQDRFGPDHTPSWELPAVQVQGEATSALREEDRVGSYQQPRWTATRRFPGTRVYVIPEGQVETEVWARTTIARSRDGGGTELRTLQEFEIGLPHRFQLDLYLRQDWDSESDNLLWGGQIEVRYAFADWGELPGNPAVYFEYAPLEGRPDKIEPKLLLGGEIAEGWHYGVNLSFEYELSGSREAEYSITTGVSHTIIDEVFSLGVESVYAATDEHDSRGDFQHSLVVGPSFQIRPVPAASINIAPLLGVTGDSPFMQIYVNMGWEF